MNFEMMPFKSPTAFAFRAGADVRRRPGVMFFWFRLKGWLVSDRTDESSPRDTGRHSIKK